MYDIEESYELEEARHHSESLWDTLLDQFIRKPRPSFSLPLIDLQISEIVPDMDDITTIAEPAERTESTEMPDFEITLRNIKEDRKGHPHAKKPKHFIKLTLTETEDIVLYENVSLTALKGTEEAEAVEKYNADYEYLTKGAGRNRRTNEAEVQTENVLVKSRSANTERIKKQDQASFVSNFEM